MRREFINCGWFCKPNAVKRAIKRIVNRNDDFDSLIWKIRLEKENQVL